MIPLKQLLNERIITVQENLLNRVRELKLVSKSWTPEGQPNPVSYKRVVFVGVINGNLKEVEVKVDPGKLELIEAFAESENQQLLG